MTNNVSQIQKQIKAFNKALSRADKAGLISDQYYAAISDLIDPERMTKKGYAMAGSKYLENLTPEELLSYSADIQQAKDLIDIEKIGDLIDFDTYNVKDRKGLLWGVFNEMEARGLAFDSDQVQRAVNGEVPLRNMVIQMNRYLTEQDYGLGDFNEWWYSQEGLH